jgi:hypothetical protein
MLVMTVRCTSTVRKNLSRVLKERSMTEALLESMRNWVAECIWADLDQDDIDERHPTFHGI